VTEPQPLLYTARQCAQALGIDESTFNRMFADGRIPARIQHPMTFGQEKCRKYSRVLLERWAAGDPLDDVAIAPLDLQAKAS
jgi:hypothetical protein